MDDDSYDYYNYLRKECSAIWNNIVMSIPNIKEKNHYDDNLDVIIIICQYNMYIPSKVYFGIS